MRGISIAVCLMLLMLVVPASEARPAPPTPSCSAGMDIDTGAGSFGYEMSAGCQTTVYAFRGVICVGGWGATKTVSVGGTSVEVSYCTGGPDPTGPGCSPKEYNLRAGITLTTARDCSATLTVDIQDCLWNEAWHTQSVGPATVRMSYCQGPPTS